MNMRSSSSTRAGPIFDGEPGEEHYNPIGVVHGGYASTLLDSALGCAVHTTAPARRRPTRRQTLEVKYLRPITPRHGRGPRRGEVALPRPHDRRPREAKLIAAATGKLLARGTTTCLIFGS